MKRIIYACFILFSLSFNQDIISGYLRAIDVSVCMDDCGLYQIEPEFDEGFGSISVIFRDDMDTSFYLNRFVEIVVDEEEVNCIECSALQILDITISDECNYPVNCFADPCDVVEECQLNTPIDCVSNYCGGCYADFYDLDNNLVYCYDEDAENDECYELENIDDCLSIGCDWDEQEGCFDPSDWEDEDNLECSDFDNEEECRLNECEWQLTPVGIGFCIEIDNNEGEPSPCSDFSQEDCEWFDECVWTDNGCQDFDWEEDNFSCEELSQDECSDIDSCIWEYSNNIPGGGYCIEVEQDLQECSDIDNQDECEYLEGCEWEDSSSNNFGYCVDSDENEDDNGPPECLLDCEGIEFINPEENPYETCDWVISNFGPNNFFNECAEDCNYEIIMEINEYVELCFECLSDNNCDEIFDDEDEQDSECLDFDNEEDCRLNECEWQLNPVGIGECVEVDSFNLVCEDLSDVFFGWCEMIIGVGWNGQECAWYSGCDTIGEDGVDYSNALFDSIEECEIVCSDNQEGSGYLYGTVEYTWGDAIELVSGALVQITSANMFYVTETNEQGFYEIDLPEGQYSVSVEAYDEYQNQDIYIISNQEHELNFEFGDWYYPNYALLRLEGVTASPGEEVSVPLILESDLDVAGVQFSINYVGLAGNYLYPVALTSMNNCFTANFNDLNGEFIGIIFSLEGCSYPAGVNNYIADLVFEVSDNVPPGSEVFLNFNSTLVSDVNGNEILSYGEGASVLFGLQGDVNSDGSVNILDIVMIVNFAIYIEDPTAAQFWASDINQDGLVNILDIVQVVNLILDN